MNLSDPPFLVAELYIHHNCCRSSMLGAAVVPAPYCSCSSLLVWCMFGSNNPEHLQAALLGCDDSIQSVCWTFFDLSIDWRVGLSLSLSTAGKEKA